VFRFVTLFAVLALVVSSDGWIPTAEAASFFPGRGYAMKTYKNLYPQICSS